MFVYFLTQRITSVQQEQYYRYKNSELKTLRCMVVSKNCSCIWLKLLCGEVYSGPKLNELCG